MDPEALPLASPEMGDVGRSALVDTRWMVAPRRGPPACWRLCLTCGLLLLFFVLFDEPGLSAGTPSASAAPGGPGSSPVIAAVSTDDSATPANRALVAGIIALAACCMVLLALLARARRAEPKQGPARIVSSKGWRDRVQQACAEGRSVVEQTIPSTAGEPGSGLTLSQLGHIESRLDLLIALLDEIEIGAPSPHVAQSLRIGSVQARALNGVVQTERQLRLATVHPSTALLEATALQLTKARAALDQSLRQISHAIVELG